MRGLRTPVVVVVMGILAVAGGRPAGADPATVSSNPWRIGRPDAIAVSGSTLYFSNRADFLSRSTPLGGFAVFSTAEAIADPAPMTNGTVSVVLEDGAGGWFIGGAFTTVGGQPRANLARVRADGSVDPTFVCNTAGGVHALARSGADLVIGGGFSTVNLVARVGVAVVNATSGLVQPAAPVINGSANALAIVGGTLVVGGTFSAAGGQARSGLAAFTLASGALVPTFTANLDAGRTALAIARSGASLFVGGNMSTVNGMARPNLVKIDAATGSVDPAFNAAVDSTVSALAVEGAVVFAGGAFATAGGLSRARLAALDAANGASTTWRADVDATVSQLRIDGGVLYAVGAFDTVGGQNRQGAAAVTTAAPATVLPWQPSLGRSAAAVAVANGRVAVGGSFAGWNAARRRALGAIDLVTGELLPWAPTITGGGISRIAVVGSRLLVAGPFTAIDGVPRSQLAAFDLATHALLPLSPTLDGAVYDIAAIGDVAYLAGEFSQINGAFRIRLAAIDLASGQVLPWDPQADVAPFTLVARGDRLLVAGPFTSLIGTNGFRVRHGFGEITTAGVVTPLDVMPGYASASGYVAGVALDGNRLFLSGDFTSIQGIPRQRLAAVDVTTGALLPWAVPVDGTASLSAHRGWLYLAGIFSTVGGQPRAGLARVDTSTGSLSTWLPTPAPISGQLIQATDVGVVFVGDRGQVGDRLDFFPEQALGGAPGPPTHVTARTVGSTLTVTWQPPVLGPRPGGYVLEAGTAPGLADVAALPLTSTRFSIAGVPPMTFHVRVRAVNGAGAPSGDVAFTAGLGACTAAPAAPSQVTAIAAGATAIISWATSPGATATSFTLQAGTASGVTNIGSFPLGAATSFSTGGVPPGAYFVRVVASNACGPSPASSDSVLRVGGAAGPPGPPVGVHATTAPGTLALSWTSAPSGGAPTGHVLEAGTGPGLSNIAVVPLGPGAGFAVGGVPPGTYYLRLRAANGAGASAASDEVVAIVP